MAKNKNQKKPNTKQIKEEILKLIQNLDENKFEDRNKIYAISKSIKTVDKGVTFNAAGTLSINYNSVATRTLSEVLIPLENIFKSISEVASVKDTRNNLDFSKSDNSALEDGIKLQNFITEEKIKITEEFNKFYKKGYGSKYDIEEYKKSIIKNAIPTIEKMIKKGNTEEEIAKELNVDVSSIRNAYNLCMKDFLNTNEEKIQKSLAKKSVDEVAEEFKVPAFKMKGFANYLEKRNYNENKTEILKLSKDKKSEKEIATTLNLDEIIVKKYIKIWTKK